MQQEVVATQADFARLIQENPVAAAQLKSIVLERENAALQAELEKLRNGHAEGQGIPEEETEEVG